MTIKSGDRVRILDCYELGAAYVPKSFIGDIFIVGICNGDGWVAHASGFYIPVVALEVIEP